MLEEIRKFDECDMETFGKLESSEETIAIVGDSHRRRNRTGMG